MKPSKQIQSVEDLIELYNLAMEDIRYKLRYLPLNNYTKQKQVYNQIINTLNQLDIEVVEWVDLQIPKISEIAVNLTLKNIEKSNTLYEGVLESKRTQELIQSYLIDTKSDLQMVVSNVKKKIQANIRKAQMEILSGKDELYVKKSLEDSVNYGLTDVAGRNWKPHTYVKVVGETKLLNLYRDTVLVACLDMGIDYAIISSHGADDSCRPYEGRIIKMNRNASGDYPAYIDVQYEGEIFHIHCKHVLIPLKSLNDIPSDISTVNNSPSFASKIAGLPRDY